MEVEAAIRAEYQEAKKEGEEVSEILDSEELQQAEQTKNEKLD